jgi:hypothetical protein
VAGRAAPTCWRAGCGFCCPALTIYRGDSWINRSRCTYGPSWATSIEVARTFAEGTGCTSVGGSVVLEAMAPADAIVCALHPILADVLSFPAFVFCRSPDLVEIVAIARRGSLRGYRIR